MNIHTFKRRAEGFTAIELLVAIIVGVLLLSAAYQLYSVALSSSGDAQRRSKATNVAYDLLRTYEAGMASGSLCSAATTNPAIPSDSGLTNASATITTTCPYNEYNADGSLKRTSGVTLVTATVSYDSPNTKQVVRAIAVTP
jgi:prepilin-type N-terminal cleavage/methylation domain-containing protein